MIIKCASPFILKAILWSWEGVVTGQRQLVKRGKKKEPENHRGKEPHPEATRSKICPTCRIPVMLT